jgi:antitoxin ParD1/3/4
MPSVTISLPEPLKEFVDQQVAARGFGDVSEFIGTLLREAQERESRLEELLLEGMESGEDIPIDEEFWKGLRTEASQMIEDRSRHKPRM